MVERDPSGDSLSVRYGGHALDSRAIAGFLWFVHPARTQNRAPSCVLLETTASTGPRVGPDVDDPEVIESYTRRHVWRAVARAVET